MNKTIAQPEHYNIFILRDILVRLNNQKYFVDVTLLPEQCLKKYCTEHIGLFWG